MLHLNVVPIVGEICTNERVNTESFWDAEITLIASILKSCEIYIIKTD